MARWLLPLALLALVACGGNEPATPAQSSTLAAEVTAPVAAPVTEPAAVVESDVDTDADVHAGHAVAEDAASTESDASTASAQAEVSTPVVPEGPEPREGTDYQIIDPPQVMSTPPGKVEIAEVFSYTCIHCARLDTLVPAWKATLPPQVNFVHAPMSHGAFEPIARGFYAAQAMGVLDQTHSGMFKALAEQQRLGGGKIDDIAKLYGELGVDAQALKATASSFAVNTQIARGQKTLARWGIEGTPTLVVAGKYRVVATGDRGHEGMLQAARWLAQREVAQMQAAQ